MNKKDLIEAVAADTGETKRSVTEVLDSALAQIQRNVKKGERVALPGFGTFERRQRSARTGRNPQTGEPIKVKAAKVPAFKAGSAFKELVNGKK